MSVTRITEWKSLNTDEQKTQYEKNYSDNNVADIRKVMKDFKQISKKRKYCQRRNKKKISHVTFFGPLFSVHSIVNSG